MASSYCSPPPVAGPSGYVLSHTLLGHTAPLSVVKYSPCGSLLASAAADGVLNLWDARSGAHIRALDGHKGHRKGINDLAWSADSRLIATASDDKTIRIWSVEAGKAVHARLKGHSAAVLCLAFNPQGNLLASGSMDERLIVWDVRQGLAHHTLNAHSDPISAVDFNRDGTLLVSGSWDGLIRLWDSATGQCLKTLVHEVSVPLASIAFTPNAHHLLSTTLDSTSRLWTFQPAKVVKTFGLGGKLGNDRVGCGTVVLRRPRWPATQTASEGEGASTAGEGYEQSAGQSSPSKRPDEVWLVGGTEEGRVVAWELQSRKRVLDLGKIHSDSIVSVAAHPSLPMIATASVSTDFVIRVYTLDRSWTAEREAAEALAATSAAAATANTNLASSPSADRRDPVEELEPLASGEQSGIADLQEPLPSSSNLRQPSPPSALPTSSNGRPPSTALDGDSEMVPLAGPKEETPGAAGPGTMIEAMEQPSVDEGAAEGRMEIDHHGT